MSYYSAIIIDDEIHNAKLLKALIDEFCEELIIRGYGRTLNESKKLIKDKKPNIIFLDVRLRNELSLDIFNEINQKDYQIIITSAYDEYAIDAFRIDAVDFLMKPINISQLKDAVNKAIYNLKVKDLIDVENNTEDNNGNPDGPIPDNQDFIVIPSKSEMTIVKFEQILYLSSVRKYTVFHLLSNDEIVATNNIGQFEFLLQKKNFYRIHNSYIVNLKYLVKIHSSNGNYCELINNISLPIARRRYADLKRHIIRK